MRILMGYMLVVVFCGALVADDKKDEKIDAKKLIGKWMPKDDKDGPVVVEFAKDGTLTYIFTTDGKEMKLSQKYKVDGDKFVITEVLFGQEVTIKATIIKLTDTELVFKNDKGKDDVMYRIKDK